MTILYSQYGDLERSRPEHFINLENAISLTLDTYFQDRLNGNCTLEDFEAYELAHLDLIGFRPEFRCMPEIWYEMEEDNAIDPLVYELVRFIRVERQAALEAQDSEFGDDWFWDLSALAKDGSMGKLPNSIHGLTSSNVRLSGLRASNDAVLMIAKKIDSQRKLLHTNSYSILENTGVRMSSVITAAKIFARIRDSYPVAQLTVPELL